MQVHGRMGLGILLAILLFISGSFSMMGRPHFEGKNSLHNASRKRELQCMSQALGHVELERATPPRALALLCRQHLLAPESTVYVRYCCILSQTCTCCEADPALKAVHLLQWQPVPDTSTTGNGEQTSLPLPWGQIHCTSGPGDTHHPQEPSPTSPGAPFSPCGSKKLIQFLL